MTARGARHAGGVLPPRPGNNDAEGEDAEELKAVMKRLQDAKPPPDVLKVSIRHLPRHMHLVQQLIFSLYCSAYMITTLWLTST